ncbi:MAG: hypothetical protein J0H80_07430, partial [Rhizobiales bacterium]|nr:hypothetical protein [Hyphomicrobiales bacterium]
RVIARGAMPVNAGTENPSAPDGRIGRLRTVSGCFSTRKADFHGETTAILTCSGQNRLNFLAIPQISSQVFFLLLTSRHRIRGSIPWVPGPT